MRGQLNLKKVLDNAKKRFDIRSRIIKAFEDNTFSLSEKILHRNQAEEKKRKNKNRKKKKKQFLVG